MVTGQQRLVRALLAVGGLLLLSAYVIAISNPAIGTFHDDGIYVVTARALAEGQGYRNNAACLGRRRKPSTRYCFRGSYRSCGAKPHHFPTTYYCSARCP